MHGGADVAEGTGIPPHEWSGQDSNLLVADNRRPSTRTTVQGSQWETSGWLGRTRTGAVPLRRRLLYPLSYEPLEAPARFELA